MVRLTGFEPTTCPALRARRLRRIKRASHLEVVGSQTSELPKTDTSSRRCLFLVRVFITNTTPVKTKPEDPRESSGLERKKETVDVELSRHLRKPGKRNATGFF